MELTNLEKKHQALELKKAGFSDRQIAVKLGVKTMRVSKWFKDELKKRNQRNADSMDELIMIQNMQLDELIKAFWDSACKHQNYKAAELMVKFLERKAKLHGMDAPEKKLQMNVETGDNMTEGELMEEMKRLGYPVPEILTLKASIVPEDPLIPPLPSP